MSLNTQSPDFAAQALAALNAHQTVETAKGSAFIGYSAHSLNPYHVATQGHVYTFPSAPLAVAFLRSL